MLMILNGKMIQNINYFASLKLKIEKTVTYKLFFFKINYIFTIYIKDHTITH